jgi:ribonuclease P protein component
LRGVYRSGQTVRGPLISLRYRLNRGRDTYRAAVVVSKKVHKSAVKRNRVRRRIYEIIRLNESSISQPHEFIVTVFSDKILDWTPAKLDREITNLLKKAGVVKNAR